jgi:predicted DNA-binding transcriptional regulator
VRVILTKRDEEILALCFEQQFVNREHIENFFKGCSQRRVNFRIQKLVEGGFLKRENYSDSPVGFVYRLTPRGRKKVRQLDVKTRSVITRLNPRTLFHDALVTHCRLRVSEIWDAEFFPERALKEIGLPEIPDGLWKFASGKRVALEVECSDKGRSRFLNRLVEFGKIEALTFVIYVTSSEKMFGIVRNYLLDGPQDQPAGVVRWDDLKGGVPKIETVHGQLDLFSKRII